MGEEDVTATNGDGGQSQGNPAWGELLSVVPENLHEQVTPHLQKWDAGVQQRFDGINTKYAPFQEFLDNEVDPEHLKMGLGILSAIQNDPRDFWDTMAQQFDFGADASNGSGEAPPSNDPAEEDQNISPAFAEKMRKLEQGYEAIAKELLQERESKAQAKQDETLEKQLKDLKDKHGEFDEGYVLTALHLGAKPEDAIKQWNTLVDKIVADHNRPKAPKILGDGGTGLPGETKAKVGKWSRAETRSQVAKLLAARAAENG